MASILYVEDNSENRRLVRRVLESEGYAMLEAAGAAETFQILQGQSPDLILMDINLPEIDGYTLTSQLKANPKFRSIPIVAITANVMRGDRERTLKAGCDGYIQKPLDIDTFPEIIKSYLA